MGLIESDTLITVSLYDDEHEEFVNKRMTIAECLDSFTEECCPHAVEAEPIRHGKWKQWDSYGFEDTYECTACGESFVLIEGTPITNRYKYCPSCGAKMDEVENETD